MGVVNVTPDSFSDGGRFLEPERAVAHGRALLADGADVLDIGGESTRPGATRPLVAEELARVVPVIAELARHGATVSVDTMRAEVAEAALAAGARYVNDVSGGLADPRILEVVAAHDAGYVAMHWRAHARHMQDLAVYDGPGGVVGAVRDELAQRLEAIAAAGVDLARVVLDPGLGFAKTGDHNWALLRGLDAVAALGRPLLVGASRKSFLGALLADADGRPRPAHEREAAHLGVLAHLARRGVWGVRVHDVRATADLFAAQEALGELRGPASDGFAPAGHDAPAPPDGPSVDPVATPRPDVTPGRRLDHP
ncbi:dihydropteroate synthase [Nocardioides sp. TRM66260-LWL]|nr:dihydropteroate synthase [Nocardioides sp. TRM66260-LWL]MBZ5734849.1 dihydropteroate synthase [Nocardioides sp. TRM66260-LWL]